jgi:hypothetical protein
MAIGSIGVRQTNLTITQAGLEIRTTAAVRATVLEVSLLSGNATLANIGLGRPQAIGVTPGGTSTFVRDEPGAPVCVTTTALSWGTSPTVPLVFHRRFSCTAVGAGVIWTFPRGLVIPVSSSLVTWNITAVTTTGMDINVVIDE